MELLQKGHAQQQVARSVTMSTNARLGMAKANKTDNLFKGLSVLRDEERKAKAASEPKVVDKAMQEYLKGKYGEGGSEPPVTSEYAEAKKRRKRKKDGEGAAAVSFAGGAIKVVDQDVSGFGSRRRPPTSFSDEEEDDDCESRGCGGPCGV